MEDPSDITVDDALVAPRKVAWMHSRKIMEVKPREDSKSITASIHSFCFTHST